MLTQPKALPSSQIEFTTTNRDADTSANECSLDMGRLQRYKQIDWLIIGVEHHIDSISAIKQQTTKIDWYI